MSAIHIHAPQPTEALIRWLPCFNCVDYDHAKSPIVMFFTPWYGWDATCLRCGDGWFDGETKERPFCPGWREEAKRDAANRYRRWKGERE